MIRPSVVRKRSKRFAIAMSSSLQCGARHFFFIHHEDHQRRPLVLVSSNTLSTMLIQPAVTVVARAFSSTAPSLLASTAPATLSTAATSLIARGGATALDLGRTKLRLEGLHQYGVVTALLMNAALRLFSSTPKKLENDGSVQDKVKIGFTACVATTVVFSAYTVIVFSLLGLYSKRALGLGMDAGFVEFFQATSFIRESGFTAFVLALVAFKSSFLLSLWLNFEGKMRWWLSGLVLGVDLIGWVGWSTIMYLANQTLFSPALM